MRDPLLRILVLAHACWWFGVYAPAHQRGAIPIAGDVAAKRVASGCCAGPSCDTPAGGEKPDKDDPSRRCAVCYLVAKLDVPPVFDLTVRSLGPVELLPLPSPTVSVGESCEATYLGRAPPAAHLT